MNGLSKTLIWFGVVLIGTGVLLHFAGRLPFRLGRLPGDIQIRFKSGNFYFPVVTCLLLSLVFSLLMALFRKR